MAGNARKAEWEREIAEQAVRDARAEFVDRLAKAERERDEALAEAARLKSTLVSDLARLRGLLHEIDAVLDRSGVSRVDGAGHEDGRVTRLERALAEAETLRGLADAAARRIALREAVAMPERVTAGKAFAAEGIPPGDMLGDREWLREYRAARALRWGDGHE